jgi:hypothetical protein
MSLNQGQRLEEVFSAARALPPQERAAFLERACGGDAELRRQADSLLSAHDHAGQFLRPTIAASAPSAPMERPGDHIGRFKLLEQIGEGGFGVVWMAEQEEPVRRRVALKIIKPGVDTREVVARFEAERQARTGPVALSQRITALDQAALLGHADFVELLLAHEASTDTRDADGLTPLHAAATGLNAGAVLGAWKGQLASVGRRDDKYLACAVQAVSQTPLHGVANWRRPQFLQALLAAGADPTARDNDGKTASDLAAVNLDARLNPDVAAGRKHCAELLRNAASEVNATRTTKPTGT